MEGNSDKYRTEVRGKFHKPNGQKLYSALRSSPG